MKKYSRAVIALVFIAALSGGYFAYISFKYRKQLITDQVPDFKVKRMPDLYHQMVAESDPFSLYGRNDEMLPVLIRRLEQDSANLHLQMAVAFQHIYNGTTENGLRILEALVKNAAFMSDAANNTPGKTGWSVADSVIHYIALGYLRLAEQNNCISRHNDASCVFPISGEGIHTEKEPAKEAIRRYYDLIKKNRQDYLSIWLMNIAIQAYGSVPDYVLPEFVIPKNRIINEYDIGRFNDIAVDLGIDNNGLAGGIAMDDFDNDGYVDIINGSAALRGQIKYFHNNGDGSFSDRTLASGLVGAWEGLGMMQLDYNNDGWMDFLVTRGGWKYKAGFLPPSLYRNNGNGTFTDATIEAGLLHFAPSQTADAADIDLDGDLDVFIGHELRTVSRLYQNLGNGTFNDITKEAQILFEGYVKGVAFGDYNNDRYPDIYISDFGNENRLYRNNGPDASGHITFTNVARRAGVEEPVWSFPCWWFDYNQDGWEDLYVSAYKPGYTINSCREYMGIPMDSTLFPCLYRNNGNGTFTNVTGEAHLNYETFTMGCNYGDLDNDGWLDFYLSIGAPDYRAIFPNRMFRNFEGKYFQDCTVSGGFGQLQKGHAVGFCDFDVDGDQDVYTDIGGFYTGDVFPNSLFENPGHGHNWVQVVFQGLTNNRFGVGCRVRLIYVDGGKSRTAYYTIGKGASFGSNPIRLEAGIGKARTIESIEVTWPNGKQQFFRNVAVNRQYRCRESSTTLEPTGIKPFIFKSNENRLKQGEEVTPHQHTM